MVRQGVEHDAKRKNMAARDEDEEQQLRRAEDLAANRAHEHFTGVGHAVDVRVRELELAQVVAGISCQKTEADDQNAGS